MGLHGDVSWLACTHRAASDTHAACADFPCSTTYPLQLAPSVYDDNIFRGLDYILAAAHKRGLRVVLVLSDWWTTPGGVSQYVSWSDSAHSAEDFFADTKCKEHFKRSAPA